MSTLVETRVDAIESRILSHVLESVERTPAMDEPFSHIFFENVFPDDVYAAMIESLPDGEFYSPINMKHHIDQGGKSTRDVLPLDEAALERLDDSARDLWLGVAAALKSPELKRLVFRKLATDLSRRFGCNRGAVEDIAVYPKPTLFRDLDGYEIAPHPDTRHKVVTMQLYLPRDKSQVELGTALYKRKLRPLAGLMSWHGRFEKVKQFPFLPNSGYAFAVSNSLTKKSWHGREALPPGSGQRDTILNMYFDEPGRRY